MSINRPTFSDSWYRVAELRPALRPGVQIHRRHYRGKTWHVVQDPSGNQFFRLNDSAYQFIGLLDGRRTVAQAWNACNETAGDSAPTQGEAISLLGQLYTSNLLHSDLAGDAEGLFQRYRKRRIKQTQGYLMNLLFMRIPLLNPDRFLNRWVGLFGKLFSTWGFVLWAMIIAAGFAFAGQRAGDLVQRGQGVLSPSNLPALYAALILCKVLHEFAHAFACKKFGRDAGGRGEVHQMGVMFLVFMPMPYVDASSSWMLGSKWRRAVVGMAGMFVETAVGAIAAIIWSITSAGTAVNALAYNMIFVAGVSTLLFNINPLLRYDGYYILSDLLEIPNLSQRAKDYISYLVKRYVYGVRQARTPARAANERYWLASYGVAAGIYRVFICTAILLFIADKLFFLGAVLAVGAAVAWIITPLGRFLHYLFFSAELARVRVRALAASAGVFAVVIGSLTAVPADDHIKVEGVIHPVNRSYIHAGADGFVQSVLESGSMVQPGTTIVTSHNPDIEARLAELRFEHEELVARRRMALSPPKNDPRTAMQLAEQIEAHARIIEHEQRKFDALSLASSQAGMWVSPITHRLGGVYLRQGDLIGEVVNFDEVIVKTAAGQDSAALLLEEAAGDVEIRVRNRPDIQVAGRLLDKSPSAGIDRLPTPAMGYGAGGSMRTDPKDEYGTKTAERFFEFRIACDPRQAARNLPAEQRVVVRFSLPRRPLAAQWYRSVLQLVQKRFHV
ncbi:MAG: hypothetical protein GXY38_03020 [Planctomycetes bacterium]|nr:hypothetical protein [Planctomycetota bacterium]